MNEFKVTVILKSGSTVCGIHNTDLTSIDKVIGEIIPNVNIGNFSALAPLGDKKECLIFAVSEVSAMKIEVME